jgi:hypothetical protein
LDRGEVVAMKRDTQEKAARKLQVRDRQGVPQREVGSKGNKVEHRKRRKRRPTARKREVAGAGHSVQRGHLQARVVERGTERVLFTCTLW